MTGDSLYFVDGIPASMLKTTQRWHSELKHQFDALTWLEGKLPAAKPLAFEEEAGVAALWMSRMEGQDASEWAKYGDAEAVAAACVKALLQMHALPITDCPLDMRLEHRIALAEQRTRDGLLDLERLDASRKGMNAEALWQQLQEQTRKLPGKEDLVFTHGDYCLPNILFSDGQLTGFVDLGRCGVADRYQDLALLVRSLDYNLGKNMGSFVAKAYGLDGLDQVKVDYYQLLDEFF
jgi:aminoglycoside phosphotransferase